MNSWKGVRLPANFNRQQKVEHTSQLQLSPPPFNDYGFFELQEMLEDKPVAAVRRPMPIGRCFAGCKRMEGGTRIVNVVRD